MTSRSPNFDDIEPGQVWHVAPRCLSGTVINKFKSVSAGAGGPVGTEYVELIDASGMGFFNYPHQLRAIPYRPCRDCGVQLNSDGSVDALPGEPATHYAGCKRPCAIHPAYEADYCPGCGTATKIPPC